MSNVLEDFVNNDHEETQKLLRLQALQELHELDQELGLYE